jgi:hypothetical protein
MKRAHELSGYLYRQLLKEESSSAGFAESGRRSGLAL